jgi:charged multivesicular body protein 4
LTTLEFQKEALENAGTNAEVMKVMGFAAKAMKAAHNNMDIDQVEDLMDDVKEQQQIAAEISNAISSPVTFGQDVDDDDLLKELEEMEQEELDKVLLETGPTPAAALPEVPTSPLESVASSSKSKKKTTDEEDELAELAQWAN